MKYSFFGSEEGIRRSSKKKQNPALILRDQPFNEPVMRHEHKEDQHKKILGKPI